MRLAGFDVFRYSLPLRGPVMLGGTALHRREGLLLRLSGDDGSEGWGESAPLPGFSPESLHRATAQLRGVAGTLLGRDITGDWTEREGGELGRELERFAPAPSVRFGVELAVWNLRAASSGGSLPRLLAGRPRVPVNGLLSGSRDEVLQEARHMKDAGYETVKLKVGAKAAAEDARLVSRLVEELGTSVSLRLDANRAWGYEQAAEFLGGVPHFEYLEEPLANPGRLPQLVREFGVPVALDETLVGMGPGVLGEHRYARAVVLKPTLLGGISNTLRIAERALDLGMRPVVSSSYESGVGTAALVALASGIGERPVPAGLDTYRRLAEDVLDMPLGLPAPSVDVGEAAVAARTVDVGRLQVLQG
jgi:O-succinylbenzoate synthase